MQLKQSKKRANKVNNIDNDILYQKKPGKILDLDDFSVQMLSPDFLQGKTLKKPFNQMEINLKKTNPNGTRYQMPERDFKYPLSKKEIESNISIKTQNQQKNKNSKQETQYKYICLQDLNIRPAYGPKQGKKIQTSVPMQLQFKDKNSIISALLRKGQINTNIEPEINPIVIKINKIEQPESKKKTGPAQAKLKSLFNKKQNNYLNQPVVASKKSKNKIQQQQIDEQIQQSIEEDYGNEQFEKLSGAYQSQIKQSIRESIAGASSGIIKQSIKQSMPQSIKDQIEKSKQSLKQQINESIKKQSVQQQVYQQIFQQASISDQVSKSKSNKNFKKSKQQDKLQLSVSASKGFRTKTNSIAKSIRFAEQLTIQNNVKNIGNKLQQRIQRGEKLAQEIVKQKSSFEKLQSKIYNLLNKQKIKDRNIYENKNMDLLRKFRIQVNRLITSQNFMSKLRKLTLFVGSEPNSRSYQEINKLQDKLLGNLMQKIHDLRVSGVTQSQILNMKKEYDEKLARLLKQQQMSLKIQMDRKLHQKDLQLKKMIGQLQQQLKKNIASGGGYLGTDTSKKLTYGDKVQVQSDYSIDSQDIQWKVDLWQILPDYEKKKLYQRQGAEVTKFLTQLLINQIKNESLNRSGDISFEFPQQYNIEQNRSQKSQSNDMMRPTLNRQQLRKQFTKVPQKPETFPPLPGVKKATNLDHSHNFLSNINYLQVPIKIQDENQVRSTPSVAQVIKLLSKYKNVFLKKKNDFIRKVVKTIQSKPKQNEPLSSLIYEIRVLNQKQYDKKDEAYVKAYEQQIIMELLAIYNRNKNRKSNYIQQQMKRMYERLVVTCQVKTAEASNGFPKQIAPHQNYIQLKMAQQDKKVKDIIVNQICNILAAQFAKQMPKKKK